ncbi:hypothetical protein CTKA_00667 [Chthonomonas calidirosea]|uniref:Uncharacterized protein n=1 Tax=Chthonomonas calidirosea (strain DSM 23976 / ICMP 18418 / T49) TaxID=1303518 RepID=S0EX12_CHTCT|nr:hypothetical protein [Chthonomonas calidirosea]CCW34323.1 hypothetical protein CCALI_00489 [Chthonomonas calidirosea T49]CEK15105.1 hypothetical protein CTKA_00667 [Chthonomonas calidirosea]
MTVSELKNNDNLVYYVVHPLEDEPEEKCDPEKAGPMPMSRSVKFSLITLRAYLIIMGLLLLYRLIVQMHLFGSHGPHS